MHTVTKYENNILRKYIIVTKFPLLPLDDLFNGTCEVYHYHVYTYAKFQSQFRQYPENHLSAATKHHVLGHLSSTLRTEILFLEVFVSVSFQKMLFTVYSWNRSWFFRNRLCNIIRLFNKRSGMNNMNNRIILK